MTALEALQTEVNKDSLRQHPAFVRFWLASAGSSLGFQMVSVAIAWQIYAISGRALDLGLIRLVQFIPSLLLVLPAGHVADQFDRRRTELWGHCVEWLAIVVLAVLTVSNHAHELSILGLLFVLSVAKAFEFPALHSMLPALVPAPMLPRAMAVNASADQAAMIAGPALGGFVYLAGPGVVYGIAGLLYLVAATAVDALGQTVPVQVAGGRLHLEISLTPVFIEPVR
jgi:Transmembrane secretion effector